MHGFTFDIAYGVGACRKLARNSPWLAIANADNYELFALSSTSGGCSKISAGYRQVVNQAQGQLRRAQHAIKQEAKKISRTVKEVVRKVKKKLKKIF